MGKKTKKGASLPIYKNPWEFTDTVSILDEDMKLDKSELGELECRLNYGIKCLSISLIKMNYYIQFMGTMLEKRQIS